MTITASEHLPGVTYDSTAQTTTINWSIEPWATLMASCDPLTATNSEQYDVALLLGLETACNGKDSALDSPVGRGALPFDGIETQTITRTDGTNSAIQTRKQIYLAVYTAAPTVTPSAAVNND